MNSLPTGSASVCFDTTALIHFNAIGALDKLGEWFPRAFAPAVVIEEEIRGHLGRYPKNQAILDAAWLEKVDVTEPDDLRDVAEIHRRFGRGAGQDRGEAEVVVLCARHRWTGIIDDSSGQVAANDYDAPHCSILTMIIAAAASGWLGHGQAWKLHCELAESRGDARSALTAQAVHRPPFHACIKRFAAIASRRSLTWPHILATPGFDGLVIRTRNETP
jgi:predicted nucleic acid-binding protein